MRRLSQTVNPCPPKAVKSPIAGVGLFQDSSTPFSPTALGWPLRMSNKSYRAKMLGALRAHSSVGQSGGLIIRWSQVRVLVGPPFVFLPSQRSSFRNCLVVRSLVPARHDQGDIILCSRPLKLLTAATIA